MARKKRRARPAEQPAGLPQQSISLSPSIPIAGRQHSPASVCGGWYHAMEHVSFTVAMLCGKEGDGRDILGGLPLRDGIIYIFTDKEFADFTVHSDGVTSGIYDATPVTSDPRKAADSALEREATVGFASLSPDITRHLQATGMFNPPLGGDSPPVSVYTRNGRNYFVF